MRIAYIHNVEIELDSRAQKEIATLREAGHEVFFYGWNKSVTSLNEKKVINLRGQEFLYTNLCEKVKKGTGLKENYRALVRYEWKLLKVLTKKHKMYDVIHVCSLDTAIIGLLIAKMYRKKCVYDIYDDYADSHVVGNMLYRILKHIDKFLIEHVNAVIICSESRMRQMASTSAKKIIVVHNTPDLKEADVAALQIYQNDSFNKRFKIAYVGNLCKGRFIYELAQIVLHNPEWELHCAGSGELEEKIKQLADSYNNIFFYGRLDYEEVIALEMQCDIIPALYDPDFRNHQFAAPNKFYEALFLGKPMIMVHNTGMDSYVKQYNLGEMVTFNKESIETALKNISNNIELWNKREKDIKEVYMDKFSWDIMRERLLNLYKELN